MHTPWIERCTVQRVSLRDGLVLDLDDYNELVIATPIRLTLPPIGGNTANARMKDFWSPKNADGGGSGIITLRRALDLLARGQGRGIAGVVVAIAIGLIHHPHFAVADIVRLLVCSRGEQNST